jgi:YVTN family beta-propeller protein
MKHRTCVPTVVLPFVAFPFVIAFVVAFAGEAAAAEVDSRSAPFFGFESGPVNSLLRTRDGTRLLVLNTTDHRVEVHRLMKTLGASTQAGGLGKPAGTGTPVVSPPGGASSAVSLSGSLLTFEASIFTGLEPVAMVQHPTSDRLIFVVNHVSDSVAVIDLELRSIVATIPVGDEPAGIAIAGGKAFVACARAPQGPLPAGATLPGPIDENVVVVFQSDAPYTRSPNVVLHGMKPRGVALSGDGSTVFVTIQNSGNHTTLLDETETKNLGIEQYTVDAYDGGGFAINPVLLRPEIHSSTYARGWYVPNAGRIVFDHEHPSSVHQLQDHDVFALDAATGTKLPFVATGVGTTLYGIARNPVTNALWITNTDADNRTRFESRLNGKATTNRITIVDPSGAAHQVIDLATPTLPTAAAIPGAIEFSTGAQPLAFVAAQGSSAVLVFDAASGAYRHRIPTGAIPSGLAVDSTLGLLFVHSRGDHALRAFDLKRWRQVGGPMRLAYEPEPPRVRKGRLHLYEARADAGHGNGVMACASCHVFGHGDALAWDLGDPEGSWSYYFPDLLKDIGSYPGQLVVAPTTPVNHPLKGPMVTQSLRGLMSPDAKDDLPLHWRGDRRTFHQFRSAFRTLLEGDGVAVDDMLEFAGFLRSLHYAPNPYGPRDRVYSGIAAVGADTFGMNPQFSGKDYSAAVGVSCIDCHQGDFFAKDDFTGSRPVSSAGSFTQMFQTAQLRMAYEKHSPEITGFGLLHDGAVDGVRGFMDFNIPNGGGNPFHNLLPADKDAISLFVEHWDHGLSPLVGAQFTLEPATLAASAGFLDLAEAQAKSPSKNVDLIVKGYRIAPADELLLRGAHYTWSATQQKWGYQFDTGDFVDRSVLLPFVAAGVARFTFTCVPPGMGVRLGVDQDEDGAFDFIETEGSLDPTRPDSDGDGYTDGFELALGADPRKVDASLPDGAAPAIQGLRALEIGSDSAALEITLDEPSAVLITLGTTPGGSEVVSKSVSTFRRRHDVGFVDLPPGVVLHATIVANDKNGNTASSALSFTTLPPYLHVDAVTLEKSGSGPYSVIAKVAVFDRNDQPVAGVPLVVFFAGDLGGQNWQRSATTAADGVATIHLTPYSPAAPTEVSVAVAWVGSIDSQNPWFVGLGGQTPKFFYDTTENRANYARIALP